MRIGISPINHQRETNRQMTEVQDLDPETLEEMNPDTEPEFRYTDEELVRIVSDEMHSSLTDWESKVALQREAAYHYYYGERPGLPAVNTSDHVSRDVFDAVEDMKAYMTRTFASGRRICSFVPESGNTAQHADLRTEYVHALFMRKNQGFKLLMDAFHDGAIGKLACFKRVYREKKVQMPYEFDGLPEQTLDAMIEQDPTITLAEVFDEQEMSTIQQTPRGPVPVTQQVVSGVVYKERDMSGLVVEVVPPEDVFVGASCTDIHQFDGGSKNDVVIVRYEKAKYELIQEGFDPEIIDGLTATDTLHYDFEEYARHSNDDTYDFEKREGKDERQLCHVYEAYIWLDMETPDDEVSQGAQLWQIIISGTEVLSKERVREIPFRFWSPFRVAHKAIGMSLADVTMDMQRTTSNVIRGMIDNIYRVNTSTRIVNLEVIRNPRDVIDNPIGGIINTSQPNAVTVPQQPQIAPQTLNMVEILREEIASRTGRSDLSKGNLNREIVSHQNADSLINTLINAGDLKPMMMARSFAEMCLMPLFLDMYRIGYEEDIKVKLEIDGQMQDFSPKMLPFSDVMEVDVALTPEYGEAKANETIQLMQIAKSDEDLSMLLGPQEKYAMFSDICRLLGRPNPLANPRLPDVQKRIQAKMKEKAELKKLQIGLEKAKVEGPIQVKREELDLKAATEADKAEREEREQDWREEIESAEFNLDRWESFNEVQIEKKQQRPAAID